MKRSKFDLMVFMIPEFFRDMIKMPEIQREKTAWSLQQKQALIDSLYNDFDIPKIYFRDKEEDAGVWWLIDGQQRLTAIRQFLDNAFPLSHASTLPKHLRGSHYKELSSADQERITKRILDCVIIESTDEEEQDMFFRLNNGTPLSVSEKRNAMKGEFRDSVKSLAAHDFFQKGKFAFSPKRFAVDVFCAQLSSLMLFKTPAFNAKSLDKLYQKYTDYPQREEVESQVKAILDLLDRIFLKKEKYLKKSTLISYFLLLKHLKEHFKLEAAGYKNLYEFFHGFEQAKQANADLDAGSPHLDRELLDYQIHLNRGAYSAEAIKKRHEVLLKRVQEELPQVFQ